MRETATLYPTMKKENLLEIMGIPYRIRHRDVEDEAAAPEGRLFWIEDNIPLVGWGRALDVDFPTLEETLIAVLDMMKWRGHEVIATKLSSDTYVHKTVTNESQVFEVIQKVAAAPDKELRRGAPAFLAMLKETQQRIYSNVQLIATEWFLHFHSVKMGSLDVYV